MIYLSDQKIKLGSLFSGIGGFELVGSWYNFDPVWASEIEPAPMRITKRHFPKMKHVGDITKLDGHALEPVDIITGGSPCFPAETMVLTAAGYIPIADIKVGDLVLTHKGRWKPVTATGSRQAETYLLKGNITIETTANHPIYSADIKRIWDNTSDSKGYKKHLVNIGQWTSAIDMESKQWATPITAEPVIIPIGYSSNLNQKPMPELNEDFWYFVGRWIGDGWVRDGFRKEKPSGKGYGTIYLCDSSDKENELINIVSKMSDNYSVERDRTVIKVKFTSQVLCKWLVDNFGKGAINKTIPGWALSMSHKYRKILFDGIMDSDGWRKSDTSMKVTSISKRLILGIRMLAESLGYSTSVSYYKRPEKTVIEGRTVNQHDTYSVAVHDNKNRKTGLEYNGHKWYKCRNVIKTGEIKTVYNISVEEDDSYIADSIVVHNCQDLSVAGNQGGIKLYCPECGESFSANGDVKVCSKCSIDLELTRSGLFMEQIRVIKEMLEVTNHEYPKIIVWENVSAAISSNNGDDFQCVLEEFCGLISEKLPAARPEKWTKSGEILGKSGSIAWRTLDAQYWGVPQRRRRIFLVVDLRGQCASEILFKSESLRGNHPQSQTPWENSSREIKNSTRVSDSKQSEPAGQELNSDKSVYGICSFTSNAMKSDNPDSGIYKTDIAKTIDTSGTNPSCNQGGNVVVDTVYCLQGNGIDRADTAGCNGKGWKEDYCYTLNTIDRPAVAYSIKENQDGAVWLGDHTGALQCSGGKPGQGYQAVLQYSKHPYVAAFKFQQGAKMATLPYDEDMSSTLTAYQNIAVLIDNHPQDSRLTISKDNICQTLNAKMGTGGGNTPYILESKEVFSQSGFADFNDAGDTFATLTRQGGFYGGGSESLVADPCDYKSVVRRLTPLECERLQGFPDNWTAEESDYARYKALGNSVALPCVNYIMSGIADVLLNQSM